MTRSIHKASGDQISFIWFGVAVPAPRMTQSDKWNKRPCVMDYRAFKDSFLLTARKAGYLSNQTIATLDGIIYLPIPASLPKKLIGEPHTKKPDIDNLAKSILDALACNDQSCWSIGLEKRYDDGNTPRIQITLGVVEAKPTSEKIYHVKKSIGRRAKR